MTVFGSFQDPNAAANIQSTWIGRVTPNTTRPLKMILGVNLFKGAMRYINRPMNVRASKQIEYTRMTPVLNIVVVGNTIIRNPSEKTRRWCSTSIGLSVWNLEAISYKYITMNIIQSTTHVDISV